MIENNLIKSCSCGNDVFFTKEQINNLNVIKCTSCGVIHQELIGWTTEQYYNFYKTDYHLTYQKKKGVITYKDRYDHDCRVADLRLESYSEYILPGMTGLDIGSSNSAFVHQAMKKGISCLGLEPGTEIGDNAVTIRGTLDSAVLSNEQFDFVTMHDSIEHMIDVNSALAKVNNILKPNGYALLDLPDYFIPAGQHHWKHIEHLWMFRETDMIALLDKHNLSCVKVTRPIPGKLVFYARKR